MLDKVYQGALGQGEFEWVQSCLYPNDVWKMLSKTNGILLYETILYIIVIDALQYCTLTRPKISFIVNKLCQFLYYPMTVQ